MKLNPANERYKDQEAKRLFFLVTRDDIPKALDFAKQALSQYRKALGTPYGKEFRRPLINSILVLRRFIRHS